MVRAWYMVENVELDQREPHQTSPPQFVDLDTLKTFGVNYWQMDADHFATDPKLAQIRLERGYNFEDQVTCSRDKLPNYDETLKSFFKEHIHEDDETRLVLDGSGYFDIRDPRSDRWIRIEVSKNDMISIPPGLYHRFTLDNKSYIVANRYFSGVPRWTPLYRPQDDHEARKAYLANYGYSS
jgi:1,2-dihydroxy-3-keto-5-methylthiopentene dioxygenase